ncbi:MAG: hypothetical protein NTW38_04470 [Candidatus Aminicenantes bacterium]|nr:hypothetical protein [Candidatus Aminicenantes bacterium]
MNIPWTAVATIGALITSTTAIVALVIEGRRSRIALQTDLLMTYYDKFYSPEMKQLRKTAAEKLLLNQFPNFELEDVLDYFGIIAVLLQRKVIDFKLAFGLFDWWILRYWGCAERYIQTRREDAMDPDMEMWTVLEGMVTQLGAHRIKKESPEISEDCLKRFLFEESRALPHTGPAS